MTHFQTPQTAALTRPDVRDREGTAMLLHEALARSRHQEAVAAARHHALIRQFTAGRGWALLARYATRRAERARATAATVRAA
jgi:hypothetical protein